jgi:NifU-like protein involved in Fe-S cluster formation
MESFWEGFPILTILVGAGVLVVVIGLWLLVELLVNPTSAQPDRTDAHALVTGWCGDTMEITLKIDNGVVCSAGYWTDGCGPSSACAAMATQLALGKRVEDLPIRVNGLAVERAVGGLPEDNRHCADLAAETLHRASERYLAAQSMQCRPVLPAGRISANPRSVQGEPV